MSKYDNFLLDLTKLSSKHGIYICGCGCCGSPFLVESKEGDSKGEYTVKSDGDDLKWKTTH